MLGTASGRLSSGRGNPHSLCLRRQGRRTRTERPTTCALVQVPHECTLKPMSHPYLSVPREFSVHSCGTSDLRQGRRTRTERPTTCALVQVPHECTLKPMSHPYLSVPREFRVHSCGT